MPVQLIAVALKVVAGGALVTGFSALGDLIKPKAFAGLFAAAPSVALASLMVTVLTTGPAKAAVSSRGMIAGAVGMVAYCTAASVLVKRFGAGVGSVLAWVFWVVPALLVFWFFLR
jgi:hypothetical protein